MTAPARLDNMRVIRAPHGTELSAKSWLTEAPLRMLMNNLDPDVAERPGELVVYGGIGRAARDWPAFDRIVATLRRLEGDRDAARPIRQAGRRVPHPRRRAARAHRQLESRAALGDLGLLQRARSQGAHDVRPDDRGLVDLYRLAGHRAGHLRDLRRDGAPALWRRPSGTMDSHRRPRRHGRRAAARRVDGRRFAARRSSAARRASSSACAPAISTCRPRTSTTRSRSSKGRRRSAKPSRSRCSATRAKSCPNFCAAASGPTSSPTRPRRTIRSTAICPRAGACSNGRSAARAIPRASSARPKRRWANMCGRCWLTRTPAFRPSTTATTSARWRSKKASRTRSTSRASCRPISGRCSAAASGRSAGRRCRAIRRTFSGPTPRSRN